VWLSVAVALWSVGPNGAAPGAAFGVAFSVALGGLVGERRAHGVVSLSVLLAGIAIFVIAWKGLFGVAAVGAFFLAFLGVPAYCVESLWTLVLASRVSPPKPLDPTHVRQEFPGVRRLIGYDDVNPLSPATLAAALPFRDDDLIQFPLPGLR